MYRTYEHVASFPNGFSRLRKELVRETMEKSTIVRATKTITLCKAILHNNQLKYIHTLERCTIWGSLRRQYPFDLQFTMDIVNAALLFVVIN